jgi:hypothetical protein
MYTGQANTYATLHAFPKYLPSIKMRELDCTLPYFAVFKATKFGLFFVV